MNDYDKLYATITTSCLEVCHDHIEHIIVYGGYGRQEGYLEIKEKIHLKNDVDIIIIFASGEMPSSTTKIKESILKKIDVERVDIMCTYSIENLTKKNSVFSYDLHYGSSIIYSKDSHDRNLIPKNYPHSTLPKVESEILFLTRLWCFVGVPIPDTDSDKISIEKFEYQMSKAILTIIDTSLIQNRQYTSSYREKVKKYNNIKQNIKTTNILDDEITHWALQIKLGNQTSNLSINYKDLYLKVLKHYIGTILPTFSSLDLNRYMYHYLFYSTFTLKAIVLSLLKVNFTPLKSIISNFLMIRILSYQLGKSKSYTFSILKSFLKDYHNYEEYKHFVAQMRL